MGLETSGTLMASYGRLFGWLNLAVQAVFVLEIAVRLSAHWPRILQFFRDGWNCFDFAVVAISLLPDVGPFATVARLARVLRVTRVLSSFPELRLIVSTMLRSIPSMGHVILLLGLLLSEIDYMETLEGSGFKFNNPNVKSTCGCGSSFSA